jgi:alkyldihydroxyacetonephosphate synthase
MKCGGSLSHHHGVGKLRKAFMKKAVGTPALEMLKGLQKTIDPKGVMANQNLI